MKPRKPLARKTPLKPGKSIGLSRKNARLRKVSSKKRREIKETKEEREIFKSEMCCCWCRRRKELDVHEIFGGSHRQTTVRLRAFWLGVCRMCHDLVQGLPKAQQLALKKLSDRAYYNLELVNKTIGNGKGNRFTEADIDQAERQVVL